MGLLDDYSGAIGSPRPRKQHQRVMSRMLINSYFELNRKGFEILTEQTVTDDCNDLAPDLVIFNKYEIPVSIIEITRTYQLRAIMDKCEELMERFPDSEYFVYDYENEVLYQYVADIDEWVSSGEYKLRSQYLNKPMLNYIKD